MIAVPAHRPTNLPLHMRAQDVQPLCWSKSWGHPTQQYDHANRPLEAHYYTGISSQISTSRIEARQRLNKQVPVSPSHNESATDGSTHGKHTKGKRQSHRGTHTRRPNAAHAQTQSRPRGPRLRLHLPGTSVYDAQTLTQSQSLTHTNTRA